MTDTAMAVDTSAVAKKNNAVGKPADGVDAELVGRLVEQARASGLQLTGDGGRPNHLWLADITEHHTAEDKLYLCAVKDVWSNRIVGYSIDSRMKSRLAVAALDNAAARHGDLAD